MQDSIISTWLNLMGKKKSWEKRLKSCVCVCVWERVAHATHTHTHTHTHRSYYPRRGPGWIWRWCCQNCNQVSVRCPARRKAKQIAAQGFRNKMANGMFQLRFLSVLVDEWADPRLFSWTSKLRRPGCPNRRPSNAPYICRLFPVVGLLWDCFTMCVCGQAIIASFFQLNFEKQESSVCQWNI